MIMAVKKILDQRLKINDEDDYMIEKKREELIEILSKDEHRTIEILKQLNGIEILYTSEVFEEIAYNLKSRKYIDCLKQIQKEFPELDILDAIKVAEEYI